MLTVGEISGIIAAALVVGKADYRNLPRYLWGPAANFVFTFSEAHPAESICTVIRQYSQRARWNVHDDCIVLVTLIFCMYEWKANPYNKGR
jgi:hypothetical protein